MQLLGAAEIRQLAAELNLTPTKKLGQNFVIDGNTCLKICNSIELKSSDTVLEIGPGLGSLSLAILSQAKHLVAVEIDHRLAARLPQTLIDHGVSHDRFTILNQDALEVSELPISVDCLVANLPYNVSVPVLLSALELFPSIQRGVVMVQAEVADRMVAKPGSKEYGSPTVKASWWADLYPAGTVSRSIFWPVPNVDSSLVGITRHAPAGDEQLRRETFAFIDAAFAQRRKMLRGALGKVLGSESATIIQAAGVDPTIRGENLILADFQAIALTARNKELK
jgi:16S rRNA (adenine1518-N6/adenine1519-N6)-dimethyltransferase